MSQRSALGASLCVGFLTGLLAVTPAVAPASDGPSDAEARRMEERLRDAGGRSKAVAELTRTLPEGLEMTLRMMRSDDELVRGWAYLVIAGARPVDRRVLPALVDGLDRVASRPGWNGPIGDDEGYQLAQAMYWMGKEAFPLALANALGHERPEGRATAAIALASFLHESAVGDDLERIRAKAGKPIDRESKIDRDLADRERYSLPADAADKLLEAAEIDAYPPMRAAAIDCLSNGRLEGERRRRFERVLIASLASGEWLVQANALLAIESMKPPSPALVDSLADVLRQAPERPDLSPVPQKGAIEALGRLGPAAAPAVPVLRDLLLRGSFRQKHDVIRALQKLGPGVESVAEALKAAVPGLKRSLRVQGGEATERESAIDVLKTIGLEVGGVRDALGSLLPELRRALRDEDADRRLEAVETLGSIGIEIDGVAEALEAAATDPDETVRDEAESVLADEKERAAAESSESVEVEGGPKPDPN